MLRNLYRFYLYTVYIALLVFVAVITGRLLNALLSLTPLRGSYGYAASQAEVVQALVFAVVTWVIAGALGGLHYWLIHRDMRSNQSAGTSAIRSFFLNVTEAVAIAIAAPLIGFSVFSSLGFYGGTDAASPLSYALPALTLFGLLEWERRRTEMQSRAALAFQRLHLYGVQIFLLSYVSFACFNVVRPLVDGVIFGGNVALEQCRSYAGVSDCQAPNLFYLIVGLLWFVALWIGYGWLVRDDKARLLRLILHGASFAYGVGFLLAGIFFAAQLLILPLFNTPAALVDILGAGAQYDFLSPLLLGVLVVVVYYRWLKRAAREGMIDEDVLILMEIAIADVLSAASFWWGCGNLLYNLFQTLTPIPNAPDAKSWVAALAFVVAGLGYIPLDLSLLRRNAREAATAGGPRRGAVLALLGGGILALAIGGATALYAWMTALLGSAITNWQIVMHTGLATFIVGLFLAGIYLWFARREHLLGLRHKQQTTTAVLPADEATNDVSASSTEIVAPSTIEGVLDELLAGKITRDEAAERIHALSHVPVSVGHQE
ncbi:hypothetical protein KSF_050480 [Reticulibacter mediterranei]|uniref:DUF5671 domain-containing protein n=1 Tax=Reticulibacter mediterranei TaxID=2778369 RepID=A0A8J3IM76_9CHLR|nr:hypothetical protein [Reticulibacter mediterranei]GHO95000.1 hypothetical protein KSF_050480 [Reticulibacter mediterranei]